MKKALLKLFNSHKECFVKFGKTYNYILKNREFVNFNLYVTLNFVYKFAGHIIFHKMLLT